MENKSAVFRPDGTYHVFNRAVGWEKLFYSDNNYRYFQEKFDHYISPVAATFCYCLMPNHFHYMIRIRSEKELISFFTSEGKPFKRFDTLEGLRADLPNLISKQFSHLFNGYAQALNKQLGRHGTLFSRNFKRKEVGDINYVRNLVLYIHRNPVEAKLCERLADFKYSSFANFYKKPKRNDEMQEAISWFGDFDNFMYCHDDGPEKGFEPELD